VYEGDVVILIMAAIAGIAGIAMNSPAAMHRIYFRDNPGPGLVRAAILISLAWIFLVSLVWADESVTGMYIVFYLVMGYAAIKWFGQAGARLFGLRMRVDVLERRNVAAAQVIAAFTLATGLIFGGSLWGDADPVGDDEGGWWIVGAFFLLGWIALVCAFGLFLQREKRHQRGWGQGIRRNRDMERANATALFLLASAVPLTDAVSGDFWGWRHSLLTFGVLAGLLVAHEIFAGIAGRGTGSRSGGVALSGADEKMAGEKVPIHEPADPDGPPVVPRVRSARTRAQGGATEPASASRRGARTTEGLVYVFLAVAAWGLNRLLDAVLGAG
jgi:hypothetical protein